LTVGRDDAEVGIIGILRQQAGESGMAHIRVSPRESGHVGQPGKELACAFQQVLVALSGEPGELQRLCQGVGRGQLALLPGFIEHQPQRGDDGDEDQ
jgi:hypothetical protein